MEKRKRNENTILQLERENYESFLLKIFSRSRLLSMTGGVFSFPKNFVILKIALKKPPVTKKTVKKVKFPKGRMGGEAGSAI